LGRIGLAADWDTRQRRRTPEGHGLLNTKRRAPLMTSGATSKKEPRRRWPGFTNFTPEALRMLPVEAVS